MIRESQPRKLPAGRVPAIDGPGDRAEDLLAEVVRVGVLEPLAPGQPVDQRLVERHELAPGPGVGRVAELDDQRVSRAGAARPSVLLTLGYTQPIPKPYTALTER